MAMYMIKLMPNSGGEGGKAPLRAEYQLRTAAGATAGVKSLFSSHNRNA